jgi:hypothetical protein
MGNTGARGSVGPAGPAGRPGPQGKQIDIIWFVKRVAIQLPYCPCCRRERANCTNRYAYYKTFIQMEYAS